MDIVRMLRAMTHLALGLSLILAVPLSMFAAVAEQANAATRIGRIDIEGYCESKYPAWDAHHLSAARATLKYHTADGWRCYQVQSTSYPGAGWPGTSYEDVTEYYEYKIDMDEACRQQFGWRAWASAGNASNPYSWACYR